jgi:hypothetical protein
MQVKQQSYLDRYLDLVADCFTAEVARRVASVKIDAATRARVDELAEKANEGLLSAEERAEYEEYIEASDLLGILQAKARRILAKQGS